MPECDLVFSLFNSVRSMSAMGMIQDINLSNWLLQGAGWRLSKVYKTSQWTVCPFAVYNALLINLRAKISVQLAGQLDKWQAIH